MSIINVYADDKMVYDSRFDDYALTKLVTTTVFNKGGTCEIVLPHSHIARNYFVGYKTIVTVYKNNELIFRGRSLFPEDDFELNRTVMCEGERCFLNDHVVKPFSATGTLQEIITWLFNGKSGDAAFSNPYNTAMNAEKRFAVGRIDPYISDNPNVKFTVEFGYTKLSDLIDKLIERFGGYIIFDGDINNRTINWLQLEPWHNPGDKFAQNIEFAGNIISLDKESNSADFATRIFAHGKNDESDFYTSGDGVSNSALENIHGVISTFVDFGEVIDEADFNRKVAAELAKRNGTVTSLTVNALDLSNFDSRFDTFPLGEKIRINSSGHGIDNEEFQLFERVEDLINADNNTMTFGKVASRISQSKTPEIEQLDPDKLKAEISEFLTESDGETNNSSLGGTNRCKGFTRIGNIGIEWGIHLTSLSSSGTTVTVKNNFEYENNKSACFITSYEFNSWSDFTEIDKSAVSGKTKIESTQMKFYFHQYKGSSISGSFNFCWMRIGVIKTS